MQRPTNWHEPHSASGPHVLLNLPQVELEITRGRARLRLRKVDQRTYLMGAAPDCDLVLGDLQFPDVHAYLLRDARGVTLRWLGHTPDLTVNGLLVETAVALADQDRLRTGPYEFKIHIHWPNRPASQRPDSPMRVDKAKRPMSAKSKAESQPRKDATEVGDPAAAIAPHRPKTPLRLYVEPGGRGSSITPTESHPLSTEGNPQPLVWLDLDRAGNESIEREAAD